VKNDKMFENTSPQCKASMYTVYEQGRTQWG